MRFEEYDIITTVHERVFTFLHAHGIPPTAIILSPAAFHWMRMIFAEERLTLGSSPLNESNWSLTFEGHIIQLAVDELLGDYEIRLI
jgi:hypothetical protein